MKTIPIEEAFELIWGASAIQLSDGTLMYPELYDLGYPDQEFMYLSLDETRMVETIHFFEKDNKTVKVSGSSMYLYDICGHCREMTILTPKQLECLV